MKDKHAEKREQLIKEYGYDEDIINKKMGVPDKKKVLDTDEQKFKGIDKEGMEILEGQDKSSISKILKKREAEKAFGEVAPTPTTSIRSEREVNKQNKKKKIEDILTQRVAEKAFGEVKETPTESIKPIEKETIASTETEETTRDNPVPEDKTEVETKRVEQSEDNARMLAWKRKKQRAAEKKKESSWTHENAGQPIESQKEYDTEK